MKFFKNIFLFSLISILFLIVLHFIYKNKFDKAYIEKPSYVTSCTDKSYDYIIGGSSRAHNNFNTPLFDSINDLNGFNIGYEGSGLAQNYITLYLFLKNGNKTKNYLLQIEDNFLIDPKKAFSYPFHDYLFISFIGDEIIDECYLKNSSALKFFIWKYVPFIKYAEFNNYYSVKKLFAKITTDPDMIKQKGYDRLTLTKKKDFPASYYTPIEEELEVDQNNIYYLDKIKELCTKYNINFIIYSSPTHQKSYEAYKPKNLHNTLLNYVAQNNIKYFNFLTHPSFKNDSLFYDETHLNANGTDLFTRQFADSVKLLIK